MGRMWKFWKLSGYGLEKERVWEDIRFLLQFEGTFPEEIEVNEREITESRIPDPRKYRMGEMAGGVGSVGRRSGIPFQKY